MMEIKKLYIGQINNNGLYDLTTDEEYAKTLKNYRVATFRELNNDDNIYEEALIEVQEGIYKWVNKCDYDEDLDEYIDDGEYIKIMNTANIDEIVDEQYRSFYAEDGAWKDYYLSPYEGIEEYKKILFN